MQRRKFIATASASIPAILIGQKVNAQKPKRPSKSFVVKATESRFGEKTLLRGESPNDIKVSQKDTNDDLTIFEYTGNEKGGPPLHIHHFQDEIFYVLDGEYLFQVGEEQHNLKAGDTIFLPRKVKHAFAQLTDKGKMLVLFQPSGKMEDFFRGRSNPSSKSGSDPWEECDVSVVGLPLKF